MAGATSPRQGTLDIDYSVPLSLGRTGSRMMAVEARPSFFQAWVNDIVAVGYEATDSAFVCCCERENKLLKIARHGISNRFHFLLSSNLIRPDRLACLKAFKGCLYRK